MDRKNDLANSIGRLLPEKHGKIRVGTACQGTVLLFQEAYRKELKEKMDGNFYVFFPSAENCIWISGTIPFPEVQKCFQKIIEQTFSRESWVTDRIYLCDGKSWNLQEHFRTDKKFRLLNQRFDSRKNSEPYERG